MTTADYRIDVDWGGDGTFSTSDTVTTDVLARSPVTIDRGRDQARQYAPPMAGALDFTLDNRARRYSPENSSGALYGNLLPGRQARVVATYSGSTYILATTIVDDLLVHPNINERAVDVPCLGTLSRLVGKTVGTALYQSVRTDEALGYLLDAAGWSTSTSARMLDTGATVLDWWWADGDAFEAAKTLLSTEGLGAAIYEDGQGRFVFEGRHYRFSQSRCLTSQATLRDSGAEPKFSPPMTYQPNFRDVVNIATAIHKVRAAAGSLSVVWSLGQIATFTASQTRAFVARGSDIFTGAITPVAATDYTVSAGSITTVSLDRTSGATVTITMTAGAGGATVTGLQLRAYLVAVSATTQVASSVDSTASIAAYGRREKALSTLAEVPILTLQGLVDSLVDRYQQPRTTIEITVNNNNTNRLTQILGREISDRITVVEAQTGLSNDFFIERIQHRISAAGKLHIVQFGCEKAVASDAYALWDSGLWDTDDWGF